MSRPYRVELTMGQTKRTDELLVKMRAASPRGARLARSHVVKAAVDRGLDVLAFELARRAKNPEAFDAGTAAPDDDELPPSSGDRPRSSR